MEIWIKSIRFNSLIYHWRDRKVAKMMKQVWIKQKCELTIFDLSRSDLYLQIDAVWNLPISFWFLKLLRVFLTRVSNLARITDWIFLMLHLFSIAHWWHSLLLMSGKAMQNFSIMEVSLSTDTIRPMNAINFTEILRLAQPHIMFKIGNVLRYLILQFNLFVDSSFIVISGVVVHWEISMRFD